MASAMTTERARSKRQRTKQVRFATLCLHHEQGLPVAAIAPLVGVSYPYVWHILHNTKSSVQEHRRAEAFTALDNAVPLPKLSLTKLSYRVGVSPYHIQAWLEQQ